ncbi:hypothetical protein SAMN05446635_6747 [Burkholderia sp. OK233]|nr:hypothetical protein SAMN05446635_6747 [Burkholderia sp. OK233]
MVNSNTPDSRDSSLCLQNERHGLVGLVGLRHLPLDSVDAWIVGIICAGLGDAHTILGMTPRKSANARSDQR